MSYADSALADLLHRSMEYHLRFCTECRPPLDNSNKCCLKIRKHYHQWKEILRQERRT